MKTLFASIVAIAALLTGCDSTSSKNLTPASAKQLLRAQFQAGDREGELIPFAPLAAFAGTNTFTDYEPDQFVRSSDAPAGSQAAVFIARGEDIFHRFLKAGLMEKKTEIHSYPNIAGEYEGDARADGNAFHPIVLLWNQGTGAISGSYKYRAAGGSCLADGSISGTLNTDGGLTLGLFHSGWFYPCSTPAEGVRVWHIQPTDNSGANFNLVGPVTVHHVGSTSPVTLTVYKYFFTPKFRNFIEGSGQKLKVGQVRFDNVDKLFLGETGDTSAEGQYAWHIDYNAIGQAVYGSEGSHGTGRAVFRKQPDGAWVCVSRESSTAIPGLVKP